VATVRILRFWSRLYVAHLEEEILHLREQVVHERTRAERAIDELLSVRVSAGPVSRAASPSPASHEDVVSRLLADSEFVGAGTDG
jgi:hypothetical protein